MYKSGDGVLKIAVSFGQFGKRDFASIRPVVDRRPDFLERTGRHDRLEDFAVGIREPNFEPFFRVDVMDRIKCQALCVLGHFII